MSTTGEVRDDLASRSTIIVLPWNHCRTERPRRPPQHLTGSELAKVIKCFEEDDAKEDTELTEVPKEMSKIKSENVTSPESPITVMKVDESEDEVWAIESTERSFSEYEKESDIVLPTTEISLGQYNEKLSKQRKEKLSEQHGESENVTSPESPITVMKADKCDDKVWDVESAEISFSEYEKESDIVLPTTEISLGQYNEKLSKQRKEKLSEQYGESEIVTSPESPITVMKVDESEDEVWAIESTERSFSEYEKESDTIVLPTTEISLGQHNEKLSEQRKEKLSEQHGERNEFVKDQRFPKFKLILPSNHQLQINNKSKGVDNDDDTESQETHFSEAENKNDESGKLVSTQSNGELNDLVSQITVNYPDIFNAIDEFTKNNEDCTEVEENMLQNSVSGHCKLNRVADSSCYTNVSNDVQTSVHHKLDVAAKVIENDFEHNKEVLNTRGINHQHLSESLPVCNASVESSTTMVPILKKYKQEKFQNKLHN